MYSVGTGALGLLGAAGFLGGGGVWGATTTLDEGWLAPLTISIKAASVNKGVPSACALVYLLPPGFSPINK